MMLKAFAVVVLLTSLAACAPAMTATPLATPSLNPTETTAPASPTPLPTLVPTFTLTPLPSATPTQTPYPTISLDVTLWPSEPVVPILLYHQFNIANTGESTVMKVRLDDFRSRLQALYDSGYSLVRLEDWLNGQLQAPAGRRPLILTIDDVYTNSQIALLPDGSPSPKTGIGVLWQFSQEHPDFGFHVALFTNLNAPFDNPDNPMKEEVKARVIVWCIEHDAIPYNHLWGHPRLSITSDKDIPLVARKNDDALRKYLHLVNRDDLAAKVANIIALPEGLWPATKDGVKALLDYHNPEGKPLLAVMEAMTPYDFLLLTIPKYLLPPYAAGFDVFHIPRTDGSPLVIDYLTKNKEQFLAAQVCTLSGIDPRQQDNPAYLKKRLQNDHGACPEGVYALKSMLFRVTPAGVEQLYPK
jgi:hypothetical protein